MASPEDPKRSKLPRGNALLGVLLIASALIAGLYVHEGSAGPVHAVRGGIAAVLSPATLLGGAVSGGESAASDALENAAADDASYSELKDENARLRAAVIEMEEYRQEADRLQGLLDLQDQYELTMVTGRVIGTQPSAWNQVITLNVGTDNGVEAGLPVIGPSGLLGQVVSATTSTCDVRLITDPQSGVSVYIQGSRVTGIVRGSLDGLIYLEDVDPSVAVKAGDVLVTSGLGGAYFGGLPVGTVSNVETRAGTTDRTIVVTPLSDVTALQEASVIVQTTSESQATEPSSSNNSQANATKKGGR